MRTSGQMNHSACSPKRSPKLLNIPKVSQEARIYPWNADWISRHRAYGIAASEKVGADVLSNEAARTRHCDNSAGGQGSLLVAL